MSALPSLLSAYRARTPGSARQAQRACAVMPGGDTRNGAHHPPYSLTIMSAAGPWLRDVDGNEYLDLVSNSTSLVHGNAYPPVVEAVQRAAAGGTAWPARTMDAVSLAELIQERVASVDLVRFCNSGTEANLLAQRLASAVTGRDSVLAARAGYHGSADVFMAATTGAGGPRTLLAEHGDLSTWAEVLERHGGRIAAVFVEPVLGAGGVVEAPHGFLAELAELSRQAGALFVLDEVITFRLAPGGAQSLHGVTPDLTTFGKVIGGGLPVGAIGGRRQLMERYDPNRPGALAHGGTYNGNPVTTAAGLVTVQHLTGPEITRIGALAQRLADGVVQAARAVGLPASVRVAGSIANVYLQDPPPRTALDRTDGQLMSAVHLAGLVHGLFFTSRGMLATSTALDESLVDEAVRRMTLALRDVADSVAAPPVS